MIGEPPLIELRDVSLAYRLARKRTESVKQFAIWTMRRQLDHELLWAVRGASVEVARGEVLGVVGANGAGKSTMLKLISGVLPPTKGRVIVRGVIAPLVDLGAGLNPELTGNENLLLYGALLGRDPRDLRRAAGAIAEWAGLEDFMDVPVRGYSSGMLVRLAFAVATATKPDVLLIDEALSVGDAAFVERSRQRIDGLIHDGTAVIFVSHALDLVRELSSAVLWLDRGRARALGDPADVIRAYRSAAPRRIKRTGGAAGSAVA